MPSRAHDGDAGVDLYSALDVELAPGQRALVPTGVAVAIPYGMVGLVHPRSGLAARVGLSIVGCGILASSVLRFVSDGFVGQ